MHRAYTVLTNVAWCAHDLDPPDAHLDRLAHRRDARSSVEPDADELELRDLVKHAQHVLLEDGSQFVGTLLMPTATAKRSLSRSLVKRKNVHQSASKP